VSIRQDHVQGGLLGEAWGRRGDTTRKNSKNIKNGGGGGGGAHIPRRFGDQEGLH